MQRIPENGGDELDEDGSVHGQREGCRTCLRGGQKCRIGDVDARSAEAEIADGYWERECVLLPDEGIDLDKHSSVRAKVVPRGHGGEFYGGERFGTSPFWGVDDRFWGAGKNLEIEVQRSWVFAEPQGNIRPAARFQASLSGDDSPIEMGALP